MSITFPLCPVCHKPYSSDVTPVIVQPCCHGICRDCITTFIQDHEGKTCPTCRADITDITPNYDLREMCQNQLLPEWTHQLIRVLPAGTLIEFTPSIEDMAPLIYYRLRHNFISDDEECTLRKIKNCLTKLILEKPYDYILKWILALNFEEHMESILISFIAKQNENYKFLIEEGASWILPLIEM